MFLAFYLSWLSKWSLFNSFSWKCITPMLAHPGIHNMYVHSWQSCTQHLPWSQNIFFCFDLRSNSRPRAAIMVSSNITVETLPHFTEHRIGTVSVLRLTKFQASDIFVSLFTFKNSSLPSQTVIKQITFHDTISEPTFVSSHSQSLKDWTVKASYTIQSYKYWEILDQKTLSDHKLIKFQFNLSRKFALLSFQNPRKLKADMLIARLQAVDWNPFQQNLNLSPILPLSILTAQQTPLAA